MVDPSIQYLHICDYIGTPRRGQGTGITIKEDMTEYRVLQNRKLPSPSQNVSEREPFNIDHFMQHCKDSARSSLSKSTKVVEDGKVKGSKHSLDAGQAPTKLNKYVKIAPAVALAN